MQKISFLSLLLLVVTLFTSCADSPKSSFSNSNQLVHAFNLNQIRLGDGVPLGIQFSLRWEIDQPKAFYTKFDSAEAFQNNILKPRAMELASEVAHDFMSVDSVFANQRQEFIDAIKSEFYEKLGSEELTIWEVIVSNLTFPNSYTAAMEQAGLQKQELERIRQQNILDLERANADRKKAQADAQVEMAKAEANAKVQAIQAKTERNRRDSELAKAETEAQIAERQAKAEAERQKLLAKADLVKQTDLKNLDVQKQRDLMNLQIEKQRLVDKVAMEHEIELAKMYQSNPVYASYKVNKELAGKVEIAVLPTGNDSNIFGNFLNETIKNNKDK